MMPISRANCAVVTIAILPWIGLGIRRRFRRAPRNYFEASPAPAAYRCISREAPVKRTLQEPLPLADSGCNFRLDCAALGLITLNGMKLEKMAVSWHGLLPCLTKFVEQWQPPVLRGETKYRDHLLETLRASVPVDAKVEKEYRHRGTTAPA